LKLNVAAPPPVITEVSTGGVFGAGAAVNLSVTATGAGLTYQWRRDGVAIAGATSSQYLIPAFASDLAGTYTVVVAGSGGAVTSDPIVLALKPAFDIWRERFWSGSADLSDPAISGPLGDPDRDGLENVLEYVLELNPSAIDPDSIGDLMPDPADPAFLLMSVPLDPLATDVVVQWQRSVDLGGDRWVIVPENDPEYQVSRLPGAMSIRFPKALGAGFFRLRATLN
jgi:hypothetical protein